MREITSENIRILVNEQPAGWRSDRMLTQDAARDVLRFHRSLPGYGRTELVPLSAAAGKYGVKGIFVKDESSRFGLKAFKGLGGSYAVFRTLCELFGLDPRKSTFGDLQTSEIRGRCKDIEFATATDGNHGKGVAWAAKLFGCRSHVFMPKGSAEARRKAIEDAGASEAVVTEFNYDGTVDHARRLAEENGWTLLQDTSWEGYEKAPGWIIEGYLTLAAEACEQLGVEAPTHVFLQAGVGAMAGGVAGYLLNRYSDDPPAVTIVEPADVACVYLSAKNGRISTTGGDAATIMAGLNCETPCGVVWPILRDGVSFYCACGDCITEQGMRAYAHPHGGDPAIVSGESGAVTYGLLLRILQDESLRKLWGMNGDSVVLLINTEGATDPEGYDRVVEG